MSTYSNVNICDTVRVANTSNGYYEMLVINKVESSTNGDQIWLLDKAGRGEATWNQRTAICQSFVDSLAASVRSKVTSKRLLSSTEAVANQSNLSASAVSAIKDLIGNSTWWSSDQYDSVGAYAITKYRAYNHDKSFSHEIHPLIILNGSDDIPDITLPPKKITVPTLSKTTFAFEETPCEPTINYNGNEDNITTSKSYNGKQSVSGTYTITFTLKDTTKFNWSNNSAGATAPAEKTWVIKEPVITYIEKPTIIGDSFKYNGSPQKPTLVYDAKNVDVRLPASYVDVGRYLVTFSLKDKTKTQWVGGGTNDISFAWDITGTPIPQVTISQKGTLTYNGKEQTPAWNNYDPDKMTIGGTTSAINAGDYIATFTPKPGLTWSDGTVWAKEVKWNIGRKPIPPPTPSWTVREYNGGFQSPTWDFHGEEEAITSAKQYGPNGEFLWDILPPKI